MTAEGAKLAAKISAKVGGQTFAKGKDYSKLAELVAEVFGKFDGLIFICAAGIVVRMIAPHLVDKLSDPAVLVVDERGQNVISLLSGHVGRANELTVEIAKAIEANPVITTATDVEGKFSVDAIASRLGLVPEPKEAIKAINAAIRLAKKNDLVLILGKGHETTILRGEKAVPFEDIKVAEKAVKQKLEERRIREDKMRKMKEEAERKKKEEEEKKKRKKEEEWGNVV